jgi:4-amino-4-deoxy-L-arabinose transferase-like glycosyltransferase
MRPVDELPASALAGHEPVSLAARTEVGKPAVRGEWLAVSAITLLAAVLRLLHLGQVSPDPFYDAAVRSMTLSLHNFFFGAFEPGASVSIDKPPVDLWLQVISVKLLGFSSTTLKLPEAFAGIATVPLLYACARRLWGIAAGLAAAAAIALLPVEVITSRSDTMDAVMMALIVLALLLLIRACESGRTRWLVASAAAMGLAFDVKLLESVIALPGLALIACLGLPSPRRRRTAQLAAGAATYVAVALSWLTITLLVPANDRPFAIGSTNGSAWNAAFVFNGTERLGGTNPEPQSTVYEAGRHYPQATQSERDRIPIVPPSPTRLFARIGPLSGLRLGLVLLAALLFGAPALAWAGARLWRRRSLGKRTDEDPRERVRVAVVAGLAVWLIAGIALFSHMARLHPRYVETFVPAVALTLGAGVAWACSSRGRTQMAVLAAALVLLMVYAAHLLYGTPLAWLLALAGAAGAIACAALARAQEVSPRLRGLLAPSGALALTLLAVLAIPFSADVTAIDAHVTDAGYVGALPGEELQLLSSYLRAHQDGARYEVAAESATGIGALVVQDARPIVVLTSYNARVFTTVSKLEHLIAQGKVRYAFLNSSCSRRSAALNPGCSAPVRWVRAHGTDVSRQAGLRPGVLWRLPGVAG